MHSEDYMKKKYLIILSAVIVIVLFAVYSNNNEEYINKDVLKQYKNDELFLRFMTDFPDVTPIVCGKCDVTNDKIEDLVVIYRRNDNNFMRVLIDGENIIYTDEVSAPIENQTIEFKNIDHNNEMEIIISGYKRGNFGYAIYRIIDNQVVNLFGEGMENCC